MNGSNLRLPKRKRKVWEYAMLAFTVIVIIGCQIIKLALKEETK